MAAKLRINENKTKVFLQKQNFLAEKDVQLQNKDYLIVVKRMGIVPDNYQINLTMNRKILFWPLAAMLLTACENGLVGDGIEDVGSGQVKNSLLQVRTRGGSGDETTVAYPVTVYVFTAARNDVTPAPAGGNYLYKNNNGNYNQFTLVTGATGSANYITGINLRPVAIVSITKD